MKNLHQFVSKNAFPVIIIVAEKKVYQKCAKGPLLVSNLWSSCTLKSYFAGW